MKVILDEKQIEVEERKTILEIAKENGIFIPSLCDHSQIKPFSGCRLCLVEVKGLKGYIPSCSIYAEEGMEVITNSPGLIKIKKKILELILSEHPSACLICEEKHNCDDYKSTIRKVGETTGCVLCANNGSCELQDIVEALDVKSIHFPAVYRDFEVHKNDPFFDRNYNMCILCGRCVRVCHELRGASAITFTYRGSESVIGTVLDKPLLDAGCQFCGACVDVCPTGALLERSAKYLGAPEQRKKTICPLCSMGCELTVSMRNGKILSTQPSVDGPVNHGQGCVKGRFILRDVVKSEKRISSPMVRKNGYLVEVDWKEALEFVAKKIKGYTAKEIGMVVSPQTSCEDLYVSQKFGQEVLKTKNLTTSISSSLYSGMLETLEEAGTASNLNYCIEDISNSDTIFLINEDPVVTQPIIWLEVLKAVRRGARLVVISPKPLMTERFAHIVLRIKPGSEWLVFTFLSKFLMDNSVGLESMDILGLEEIEKSLESFQISDIIDKTDLEDTEGIKKAANYLLGAESCAFLFGLDSVLTKTGEKNISSLWNLSLLTGAELFPLSLESNLRGLHAIWGKEWRAWEQVIADFSRGNIKALYAVGPVALPQDSKPEFLVCQDTHMNEYMEQANAVFPVLTTLEREGVLVNTEGRIQAFDPVIEPRNQGEPDWWVLVQLAKKMGAKPLLFKSSKISPKKCLLFQESTWPRQKRKNRCFSLKKMTRK